MSIVHADCGEGDSPAMRWHERGAVAQGVEPRGAVALRALEGGCSVTICEVSDYLAGPRDGSLGGIVLNGVVDRLPLHALLPLLAQCRRTLAHGAPLVVVSELADAGGTREPPASDLDRRPTAPRVDVGAALGAVRVRGGGAARWRGGAGPTGSP